MKSTYAVVHDGQHITNQLAGDAQRAIQLAAAKHNIPAHEMNRYMRAFEIVNTPNFDQALELACLETINFRPETR